MFVMEEHVRHGYERDGWFRLSDRLSEDEVGKLRESVARLSAQDRPEVVYERGSGVVRALHGCHLLDDVCARLVRLPVLVDLAESLLGGPVYVYQFKINLKQPRQGAAWPWHQDYTFWHHEDGMLRPDALNIAIHLDDVNETNGPLRLVPGSHRLGIVENPDDARPGHRPGGDDWRQHVSEDLAYTVPDAAVDALLAADGLAYATGPRGTICVFHPSIVHSSTNNSSDSRRALLLITYNLVANAPSRPTRPEFLVARDTAPVTRLVDDRL